jgi:endoglucanase
MFRQPYSYISVPFKQHRIKKSGGTLLAVDFDMGRSGVAYWDADSANYHVSTGKERTPWNRGATYRNEGVDIEFDATKNSYVVNHIETGEWLEYTLQVDKAGTYKLAAVVKAPNGGGKISVSVNNQNLNADVNVPASQNYQSVTISGVKLLQGANRLRFYSKSGAYNLHSLVLHP